MYELKTEYLFDTRFIAVPAPEYMMIGKGGWGTRCIVPIQGGTVEGPKIKATAKSFGADWVLIRPDNAFEVDVRLVLETDDGALIYMYYDGIAEIPEEQIADALEGKWPSVIRGNNTPRFETGHENYLWLNKLKAVGTGEARLVGDHLEVCYSVYALR